MIQQRWFVVGQLLFSVGKIHSLVSLEQWQCGTDNKTREMAYNSAEEDCPDVMDMFNECCIVHDTCYADQLGKGNCDDQFCECMNIAASKAKQISDCQMKAFAACMAVQMFGSSSYEEAVGKPHIIEYNSNDSTKHLNAELTESSLKSTTSEDKLKSGKMETTIKKEFTVNMTTTFADSTKPSKHICIVEDILPKHIYTEIFEDCPIYKDEFNECCTRDAICHQNISINQVFCALKFIECLLRKLSSDKEEQKCYESIHLMHKVLSFSGGRKKYNNFLESTGDWISGSSTIAVSSSTVTVNNLENIRWRNLLFIGMMVL